MTALLGRREHYTCVNSSVRTARTRVGSGAAGRGPATRAPHPPAKILYPCSATPPRSWSRPGLARSRLSGRPRPVWPFWGRVTQVGLYVRWRMALATVLQHCGSDSNFVSSSLALQARAGRYCACRSDSRPGSSLETVRDTSVDALLKAPPIIAVHARGALLPRHCCQQLRLRRPRPPFAEVITSVLPSGGVQGFLTLDIYFSS